MTPLKVTPSQARRLERNLAGRKPKTETDALLLAFTRECGTIEDWDGDRAAWRVALGAFTLGWRAHARRRRTGKAGKK